MSAWNDAADPAWLQLGSRLGQLTESIAQRNDIVVSITPDIREDLVQSSSPLDTGSFIPDQAHIVLDASQIIRYGVEPNHINPLSARDQSLQPVLIGTLIHECAHAAHSMMDMAVLSSISERISHWAILLEESRCEHLIIQGHPAYIGYLRVVANEIIQRGALEAPTGLTEAESLARAIRFGLMLLARVDAGILDDEIMQPVRTAIIDIVGKKKYFRLKSIWQHAHTLSDDDSHGLLACAREIDKLLEDKLVGADAEGSGVKGKKRITGTGVSSQMPCGAAQGLSGSPEPSGRPQSDSDDMSDLLSALVRQTTRRVAEEAEQDIRERAHLHDLVVDESRQQEDFEERLQIMQDVDSWNDADTSRQSIHHVVPSADTLRMSRLLHQSIKQAQYRGMTQTTLRSQLPPGRMSSVQIALREGQLRHRHAITATPWLQTRRRVVDNPPLTLGISLDSSGSMRSWQEPVANFAWALTKATRDLRGTVAVVGWNYQPFDVMLPRNRYPQVPVAYCHDGSTGCPQSLDSLDVSLRFSQSQGVSMVVIVTDGRVSNRREVEQKIARLKRNGVLVLCVLTDNSREEFLGAHNINVASPDMFARVVGHQINRVLSTY